MEATANILGQVGELYGQGQYLQAYEAAEALGPLQQWTGTEARILAGRLANNLGAARLGRVLHRLAWRQDPEHPEACYFYVLAVSGRRGPWGTWQLLQRLEGAVQGWPAVEAEWCALQAHTLAILRDFQNADRWIERALERTPQQPWVWVERAVVLELEDRPEEALQAARQALEIHPWFRPAVQMAGHVLVRLNRDQQALELLGEAAQRLQSGEVIAQLATLQVELQQFAEARANYQRLAQYWPLMDWEKDRRQWLAARLADAAYYCGDFSEAAGLARQAKTPFYDQLAERLEAGRPEGQRVLLPVAFVRQHHATCAPATLAALSRYWSQPFDHLEVAERICYDGTPAHSERQWAEEHGFLAREFRVTWPVAQELLGRGIPFTLTTVDAGTAHLQAVIGYDSYRGSLLARDPGERHFGELIADRLLEHYSSSGPRGMALVPTGQSELLGQLELPEAELYDHFYRLERALEQHGRDEAQAVYEQMQATAGDHRLTWRARGTLASYDADLIAVLEATERLLQQYPKDVNLLIAKLNILRELGRRDDRLALLEATCRQSDCDRLLWFQYARELADDARQHPRAMYLLRQALRYRPTDSRVYGLLGDLLWDHQQRDQALTLYRLAACLNDKDEAPAGVYFQAARHLGQTEAALQFLQDRFERFGAKSGWPARTLCGAYEQLEQADQAFQVLESALHRRPDDGDLLLFAADLHGRYGRLEQSDGLLEQARPRCHRHSWLRAAAYLATYRGDYRRALEYWRQVLEAEPLARDAQQCVAHLLADLEGEPAAVAHLTQAVGRFPHSYTLQVLLVEWLREEPDQAQAALGQLLHLHPADPWARRELAIALLRQGQCDQARSEVELATQLEPSSPVVYLIGGRIDQAQGRLEQARIQYRQAICQSVDFEPAIAALVQLCDTKAGREEELQFIYQQLQQQVIFGDGLLTFREYAELTLPSQSLLDILWEALRARPDLWHAWSAVMRQLSTLGRGDEARELARQAVERFPLLPRIWLELALVCRAQGDHAAEIEALEHALRISPGWGDAARELAEAHQQQGDLERARAVLQQAVVREPRDVRNHGGLAELLWQLEQHEAALQRLAHAVRLEPGYEWAWERLRQWAAQQERSEWVIELARQLTATRPHEARSWLVLAETLVETLEDHPEQQDACLAAVDRALQLNPYSVPAFGLRADCLAREGRYEEALRACRPDAFGDEWPLELRARAAGIEAECGRLEEAIVQMQDVVRQDPDYYWAWTRLALWYDTTGAWADCLEASEHLVRLAPGQAVSWGYLADAQLRLEDREAAKAHFRRALELAPDYRFALSSLFDLQLEDGQFDEAAETLRVGAEHLPRQWLLCEEARLAAARQDLPTTFEKIRMLCVFPLDNPAPLDLAVQAAWQADWGPDVHAVLDECLDQPEAQAAVGWVWVNLGATLQCWGHLRRRLVQLAGRPELWQAASEKYVRELADARRTADLRRYLRQYGRRLREHHDTWSAAGDALAQLDCQRAAVRWLADWESRPELTAATLLTLARACWTLGRTGQAAQVSRRALELPADDSTPCHRLWLALDQALWGDVALAAEYLAQSDPSAMSDYYRDLHRLVSLLVEILHIPRHSPQRPSFGRMRQQLRDVQADFQPLVRQDRLALRLVQLCRWRLARHARRPLAALWARCRLLVRS